MGAQGANVLPGEVVEGLADATRAAEELTADMVLPSPCPPPEETRSIDIMLVFCCRQDSPCCSVLRCACRLLLLLIVGRTGPEGGMVGIALVGYS